jgi:predicted enzyme related to lactoylglutathione lyase
MKNACQKFSKFFLGILLISLILIGKANAQDNQKLPDCCIKSKKEGKLCEGYPQELKAGALSFKFGYISFYTKDIPKLYEFYKKVLQLEAADAKEYWKGNNMNSYVEIPTLGAVLSFTKSTTVQNVKGNYMLEFGTTLDIEKERKRIKSLGVEMVPDFKIKNMIRFYDPDGNIVNIYHDSHIPLRLTNGAELNANVIAKMADCCKQAIKEGKKVAYADQPYRTPVPPKVGALLYRLGYVSLFTSDIRKLYDFYKNVLKVQVNDIKELSSENDFDSYFEIPTQKAVLSFSYKADAVPNNGIVQLEFEDQDNLDAEYQRIIASGAKIKENSKRAFEFKFYDPDGNLINYYHYCPGFYNQIPPNPN